jgi:3-deoxy-D-manno-octulosonate 8-phosphate phosphatase (KDO 8-P phosphatase)
MDIESAFTDIGGQFVSDHNLISRKLSGVKAFMFDWDGVFNSGEKNLDGSSSFSEVDSMGTNLLRFSYFLKSGAMPLTAIISGEKNESAFYLCKREGFHFSFFKTLHKIDALNFICEKENIKPEQVAYFFDDVLDLSIAKVCGVRIMINRNSNPILVDYCLRHQLVDYLTASAGGTFAVREGTELLVALNGNFDATLTNRIENSDQYKQYMIHRRATKTKFFTVGENGVEAVELV